MSLGEKLNGRGLSIGLGTIIGLVTAIMSFIGLNLALADRFRAQGAAMEELRQGLKVEQTWTADYEKNVRPLRDQFIRFTGELPGFRREIEALRQEMVRLNARLDRLEGGGR